jgi:hypothetical protein
MRRAAVLPIGIMVNQNLTHPANVGRIMCGRLPDDLSREAAITDSVPQFQFDEELLELGSTYESRRLAWHNISGMVVLRSETESSLHDFLKGNISPEDFEGWLISYLDEVPGAERDALWEMRLLLVEFGEGLRPLEDAKDHARLLLADNPN